MSKIELISKKYPFVDISKPDILLKRAENLQQNGNVTAALQIASDLKLIFPDSFDIGLLIGRCHVQLQNWHIAIKVFQELLEIQHDRCGLHNELSAIYLEIGDVKKALDQICLEIEYSPQNHEYYYNKGLILEQNGDLQNAIDSISQAIQLSEGFAWGYCERGRLYYLQNNLDAAEKDLVHATSINSRFPEALHNLSLVYLERGRFDSKIEMEQRALAIRPNYVSSKYGLSTTMLLLGDYEKGLQLYESRKDRPSNSHIKNRLKFNHWLGFENLSNKHLIVISEQGLGDIIQFSRFVLKVAKFAKRVTFEEGLEVKFKYRAQKAKSAVLRQVRPLGLLFGRFAYLVASTGNRAPISYRADLLENVEITDTVFYPKEGWNFKEWASESFSVFHGDALWNIKIRFSKDVANRAEKVQFHPSQKISHGRNGSLVIEMRCRGHRELIWELMHPDWIGHVKIESPEGLQKEYLGQLERGKTAVYSI